MFGFQKILYKRKKMPMKMIYHTLLLYEKKKYIMKIVRNIYILKLFDLYIYVKIIKMDLKQ